jgi:hypothetical protein
MELRFNHLGAVDLDRVMFCTPAFIQSGVNDLAICTSVGFGLLPNNMIGAKQQGVIILSHHSIDGSHLVELCKLGFGFSRSLLQVHTINSISYRRMGIPCSVIRISKCTNHLAQ